MQSNEKYSQAYLRWTVNERTQHWILAISFIVLVFTGFALKYPESWWSWPFLYAGAFDLRVPCIGLPALLILLYRSTMFGTCYLMNEAGQNCKRSS